MSIVTPWGEAPAKKDPRTNISHQFWHLQMRWRRHVESLLEPHDITFIQYQLLAGVDYLDTKDEPVNQVTLSDFLGSAPAMTSQVLKILTNIKKFITRRTPKGDTRAKHLKLTPLGEVKLRKAEQIIEHVNNAIFGSLEAAQNDFQQCILFLTKTIETSARKSA